MSEQDSKKAESLEEAQVTEFAEETEGFPKRGTTLQGRVAHLLRLTVYIDRSRGSDQ